MLLQKRTPILLLYLTHKRPYPLRIQSLHLFNQKKALLKTKVNPLSKPNRQIKIIRRVKTKTTQITLTSNLATLSSDRKIASNTGLKLEKSLFEIRKIHEQYILDFNIW